jgi:hypothetical protein
MKLKDGIVKKKEKKKKEEKKKPALGCSSRK